MTTITTTADQCEPGTFAFTPARLFASVAILTVAADAFLWESAPGAGLAVFFLLVGAALLWNRSAGVTTKKDWIAVVLLLVTVVQTALETGFANIMLLLVLTIYASGHFQHRNLHPFWRRALEGLVGLAWLPVALISGRLRLWGAIPAGSGRSLLQGVRAWGRWLGMILPAVVISVPFALLLFNGNAILFAAVGEWIDAFAMFVDNLELPAFERIVFWCLVAALLLALLGKSAPSWALAWLSIRAPQSLPAPRDHGVAVWRTRLVLIAVNILFFFANTTDVLYLWANASLPDNVTYSQFVHKGVYSLTAGVVLAAIVLSLLFVQVKQVCHAPGQRLLAHLWIAQNLLLAGSVILRLKLYVDVYELSLLRVYVVCFLALVGGGFVLLSIRIQKHRALSWLLGANALAVFGLFFIMQLWDEHRFVARWNVAAARENPSTSTSLDIEYLRYLGPSAWPSLREVADHPERFGRWVAADAQAALNGARNQSLAVNRDWRAWQWRRVVANQALEKKIPPSL